MKTSLALAMLALVVGGLQLRAGLSFDDEGLLCDYALRLLNGQVPYVQFIPPYELGRYALVAAAFALFGPSVVVMRGVFVLMLALATFFTHRIALRAMPQRLAWLPCVLLLALHGPLWKVDIHLALAASVWAACFRGPLTQGVIAGLCALDRPDLAVISVAVTITAWCLGERKPKALLVFAGSALAVWLPLATFLLSAPGALMGYVNAHLWMLQLSEAYSLPLPNPLTYPLGVVNGLIFYLGPLCALLALMRRRRDAVIATTAVAALLIWNQVRIRANFGHALQAAWPAWVLLPALVRPQLLALVVSGLFVWQGSLANVSLDGVIAIYQGRALRTHWPRADVWLPPTLANDLAMALNTLDARKGAAIGLPYAPTIPWIAERDNPTFIDNFLPGRLDEAGQRRVIADLQATPDVTVVLAPLDGLSPEQHLAMHTPLVWAYLQSDFELLAQFRSVALLKRKESAASAPP